MASRRGLVISPPVTISETGLLIKDSNIDPQELRSYLLFWDVLDFPENNLVGFGLSQDVQFLKDAGVLQRTRIGFSGSITDMAQGVLRAHTLAYNILDQKEAGVWSLARGEKSFSYSEDQLKVGRGALFSLFNALPVPKYDVPLNDILEFKKKRNAELIALRIHLEKIYHRITSSEDPGLSLHTEIDDLQRSIADFIKTAKETRLPFVLSGLEIRLDYTDIAKAAMGAQLGRQFAADYNLALVGELLGVVVSGIKIESGVGLRDKVITSLPFEYISSYHQQVF